MRNLRSDVLQWAIGGFCAFIGAAMLVVPHQFRSPAYLPFQPNLSIWGAMFGLAGIALFAAGILRPAKPGMILIHAFAGILLVLLAYGFSLSGALTGIAIYGPLGVVTIAAPFLFHEHVESPRGDGFALAMALATILLGVLFIAPSEQLLTMIGGPARNVLPLICVLNLTSGTLLLVSCLFERVPQRLFKSAHVFVGVSLIFYYALTNPFPIRAWTGFIYYFGLGGLLVVLPFVTPAIYRLNGASLRIRFSMVLALIALIPLIAQVVLVTNQEEQIAVDQLLDTQEQFANSLSTHLEDYLNDHIALANLVASEPDLWRMPVNDQKTVLVHFQANYPDTLFFATFDATGAGIARSDNLDFTSVAGGSGFEKTRTTHQPAVTSHYSAHYQRATIGFFSPIYDDQGRFSGAALVVIDSKHLSEMLRKAITQSVDLVYVVNEQGHIMTHPDDALVQKFADFNDSPPVQQILSGKTPVGALTYGMVPNRVFAGYAHIPSIGWGIVIERKEVDALNGIRAGRELAFGLMLVITVIAITIGGVIANSLTAPLRSLSRAISQFGDGEPDMPLPQTSITELSRVSTAFASLRERLLFRTEERDKAVQALSAERERLSVTLRSIGDAVIATDADGIVTFMNSVAEKLTGWTQAEALGKPIDAICILIDQHNRAPIENPIQQALRKGSTGRLSSTSRVMNSAVIISEDGVEKNIDQYGASLRTSTGEVLGAVLVLHDITERKRIEGDREFLIKASSILGTSLEFQATLDHLARLLVPQIADNCIIDVIMNEGAFHSVGLAAMNPDREVALRKLRDTYPPDPKAMVARQVAESGKPQLISEITDNFYRSVAKDDDHFALMAATGGRSLLVLPLLARDRIIGTISLGMADSGRRFIESDLPLLEDLAYRAAIALDNTLLYGNAQKAIRDRDEFLSVAAHELKTPITSMRGFAQMAGQRIKKTDALDPAFVRHAFQVIDQQSGKLTRLVTQLLDISRIEAGKLVLELQETDLAPIVQSIVSDAQTRTAKHIFNLQIPVSVVATVDSLRIEQVVTNLIDNAVKYSPDGGSIEVDLSLPTPETVRLSVVDHGIGIPLEHRGQIFSRFYQAHANRHFGGIGLGLHISRQIIELHGGSITVEFPPEGTTQFIVTLPTNLPSTALSSTDAS